MGAVERVGLASLQERFPDRKLEILQRRYDPLDIEKIRQHQQHIRQLGRTGVFFAALEAAAGEPLTDRQLRGFALLKGSPRPSWLRRQIAKRPVPPAELEFHVDPAYRNRGVGAQLLRQLADTALARDLLKEPRVTIYGDSPAVMDFLSYYGASEDEAARQTVPYLGSDTTPVRAYVMQAPSWKTLVANTHNYRLRADGAAAGTGNVIDLASYEAGKVKA